MSFIGLVEEVKEQEPPDVTQSTADCSKVSSARRKSDVGNP